jgi:hypothetical protein
MTTDRIRALDEALRGRGEPFEPPAVAMIGNAACTAVVLAAHAAGMSVQPYAVTFGEQPARAYQLVAERVGRELRVVELPVERLSADFVHLALQHRCFAIGDYEMGLLALYLCEALREAEIWLPAETNRAGWKTAARIGSALGKTLVNPLALVPIELNLDKRELERALRGGTEPSRDL